MADDSIPHYKAPPNEFADKPERTMVARIADVFRGYRDGEWITAEQAAEEVLRVIREPSEGMVLTGSGMAEGTVPESDRGLIMIWQAMIDAALAEDASD